MVGSHLHHKSTSHSGIDVGQATEARRQVGVAVGGLVKKESKLETYWKFRTKVSFKVILVYFIKNVSGS